MRGVARELKTLRQAAKASKRYPGAIPAAYASLKRLRGFYEKAPGDFPARMVDEIKRHKDTLPKAVDLMTCPSCHGGGTQRWMKSYKHTCTRCGGWNRVEKTEEAVRENEYVWGRGAGQTACATP